MKTLAQEFIENKIELSDWYYPVNSKETAFFGNGEFDLCREGVELGLLEMKIEDKKDHKGVVVNRRLFFKKIQPCTHQK